MSRYTRHEKEFGKRIAQENNITFKQAKKKYVTKVKDMDFLNE